MSKTRYISFDAKLQETVTVLGRAFTLTDILCWLVLSNPPDQSLAAALLLRWVSPGRCRARLYHVGSRLLPCGVTTVTMWVTTVTMWGHDCYHVGSQLLPCGVTTVTMRGHDCYHVGSRLLPCGVTTVIMWGHDCYYVGSRLLPCGVTIVTMWVTTVTMWVTTGQAGSAAPGGNAESNVCHAALHHAVLEHRQM